MKIIILECDAVFKLLDMIIEDNPALVDTPITIAGILENNHIIERTVIKCLMIKAGRGDEIEDFVGVKPKFLALLGRSRNLDWLKELDWYEIKVDLSNQSLLVMVN